MTECNCHLTGQCESLEWHRWRYTTALELWCVAIETNKPEARAAYREFSLESSRIDTARKLAAAGREVSQ